MIYIATHNPHKFAEIQALLAPNPCHNIFNLNLSVPEESGLSFVENAIIKARHVSQYTQTACIADDSGLVVAALNDQPGIYSARFAGSKANDQQNRDKLLMLLKNVPHHQRQAYFYCAMVYLRHEHDPCPIIATGKWQGFIHSHEQGTQGFGYDAIFYSPELQKTAAELSQTLKNKLSHRGQALNTLIQQIHEKHHAI